MIHRASSAALFLALSLFALHAPPVHAQSSQSEADQNTPTSPPTAAAWAQQVRQNADEDDFAMPVRVGTPGQWQIIPPTTQWQSMQTPLSKDQFQVATDLYYIDVNKQ